MTRIVLDPTSLRDTARVLREIGLECDSVTRGLAGEHLPAMPAPTRQRATAVLHSAAQHCRIGIAELSREADELNRRAAIIEHDGPVTASAAGGWASPFGFLSRFAHPLFFGLGLFEVIGRFLRGQQRQDWHGARALWRASVDRFRRDPFGREYQALKKLVDLPMYRKAPRFLRALGEAFWGRLVHRVTGRWPAVFWRGTGRLGGLMSKGFLPKFSAASTVLSGVEAGYWLKKEGPGDARFWKSAVEGGAPLLLSAAGPAPAIAFTLGWTIGEGLDAGVRRLTGSGITDRWARWSTRDLDAIDARSEQLKIKPGMTLDEIRWRSEEATRLSREAGEYVQKTKNPWNLTKMLFGQKP